MSAVGWFCPACQKHHAPHVETCPAPVEVRPIPGVNIWPTTVTPYRREPGTAADPMVPYWPVTSGGSAPYRPSFDPDKITVVS